MEYNGHIIRTSDSSLYDEVCTLCGATDRNDDLERRCPKAKEDKEKRNEQ